MAFRFAAALLGFCINVWPFISLVGEGHLCRIEIMAVMLTSPPDHRRKAPCRVHILGRSPAITA